MLVVDDGEVVGAGDDGEIAHLQSEHVRRALLVDEQRELRERVYSRDIAEIWPNREARDEQRELRERTAHTHGYSDTRCEKRNMVRVRRARGVLEVRARLVRRTSPNASPDAFVPSTLGPAIT